MRRGGRAGLTGAGLAVVGGVTGDGDTTVLDVRCCDEPHPATASTAHPTRATRGDIGWTVESAARLNSDRGGCMADEERSPKRDPHHALNQPASDPDPTEWPDPYDKRPDPRDPCADKNEMDFGDEHPATGATSTSEPHHEQDQAVDPRKANPHEPNRAERRRAGH